MALRLRRRGCEGKDRSRIVHTRRVMDLDLRQLRVFVAVAEELHFTRAAERLHVAQPAVSARIRELEERLGVRLLERTTRSVALTPAGVVLLDRGRALLLDAEAALAETLEAAGARSVLRVGLLGSAGSALFASTRERFLEARPHTEVQIVPVRGPEDVLRGTADVVFGRFGPGETPLQVAVLGEEPRVLMLSRGHRLAAREHLRMAELADEAFVTQPAQENPVWREAWLDEQHEHGLPGRIAAEVFDGQQLLALVLAGVGVCLVPAAAATSLSHPDVAYVPVLDARPAIVSLAWRAGHGRSAARAFVEAARAAAG